MLLSLALAVATPVAAQDFQSTPVLDTIVAQFTGARIGEQGGARAPVDQRLKLQPCPAPQLEWRSEAKDAVVVRCMAPAWRIFVPVNAVPQPKAVPPAPARAPAVAVKAEPVIRRGDPITVEAGAPGFSISREGVAMGDAAAGARLLVKVDDRKPPIQAVALEPGRARLP
ncbi:flagella basal body P-ring formation protein FlgA [Sphingomonas psychrotolerans]|uniref:Flagella basal body P-ring formation protein FlgA n=1 Tax=Sphingomonas psychrotolerans TaxID=1327635 RepID=A0ABU3N8Q4_9SPHN|nr:flagella basal body P-ring formation protein FlgA [Sphingomonas psychrotolerans]MDT8760646.1 flagella basal body P-ring formation protein FlgA [Sphingomonas psychrotolerans]